MSAGIYDLSPQQLGGGGDGGGAVGGVGELEGMESSVEGDVMAATARAEWAGASHRLR